ALAISDVEIYSDHLERATVRPRQSHSTADQPAFFTVGTQDAEFGFEGGLLGHRLAESALHMAAILRMYHLEERLGGGGTSVQPVRALLGTVPHHEVAGRIPFPDSHATGRERQLQTRVILQDREGLAFRQRSHETFLRRPPGAGACSRYAFLIN